MKRDYVLHGKSYTKKYHREYWQKRRRKIIDYLGGKCVKCGATDDLEIDHIDPSKKSFHISQRLSLRTQKEEIDKCQLLCEKHHIEKTVAEKKPFTHGTIYAFMKAKCVCALCVGAKDKWNANRRVVRGGKRGPYKQAEHGSDSMYGYHGCRCDTCRLAHNEKARVYRAQRG